MSVIILPKTVGEIHAGKCPDLARYVNHHLYTTHNEIPNLDL